MRGIRLPSSRCVWGPPRHARACSATASSSYRSSRSRATKAFAAKEGQEEKSATSRFQQLASTALGEREGEEEEGYERENRDETLPLYTNFSDALEDWQLLLLEEAFDSSSRRKVSVTSLSEESKLSRPQVLDWLKARARMTEQQAETIRAACLAAVEREESLEETMKKKSAKQTFADMSIGERRQVQSKVKEGKLSPLALKLLLKFWGRNKNPSWQNINDIARMTKLSPTIVRNWFKERRDQMPSRSTKSRRRRRRG